MLKMIQIRSIGIVLLSLISMQTRAQDSDCPCNSEMEIIQSYENYLVGKAFVNKHPVSKEQFYTGWLKGDVYLTDGNIVKGELLRYNGLIDELLWMRSSDFAIASVARESVSRFVIYSSNNKIEATFQKVKQKNTQHTENEDMYLQILVEGNVVIYRKFEVIEIRSTGQLIINQYYYLQKDGEIHRFKLNRISLIHLFKDEERITLKQIIRSKHLRMNKEAGLIEAINEYNRNDVN